MIIIVANYMKSSQQYQAFSKPLFYFTFALSVIVWIMNIVLIVMQGVFGLVGFNNTTQISSSCDVSTQTYYYTKYNTNNSTIVSICFAFTIVGVICSTVLMIIVLVLLVKLVKEEVIAFRKAVKVSLYVFSSLVILAIIIPAGYYLAFSKELAQCAVKSYNSSQVEAVAIIAIIIVALALLIWVLFLGYFYQRVSSQEKYRDVSSHQTEPQQKAQTYKYQEEKPKKKYEPVYNTIHQKQQARRDVYKMQETQQNLYESPSKRKINTYSKEPVNSTNQPQKYSVMETKGGYVSPQKRYAPQKYYNKEADSNQGELVFSKERKQPAVSKDEQEYKIYERQYLGRNQGERSILPSNGVEERESKGSDYYRSIGEPPRRFSPSRNEKQGILVKYIRGKYAG